MKKILIVDDDRNTLTIMEQALKPFYEILPTTSGEEALAALHKMKGKAFSEPTAAASALPDLVLLDIDMPGMNGYEVLDRLKGNKELKNIPVVFLTGLTDEQAEMKGLEYEVLDYLKKPVGMRVLLMRVQHYLNLTAAQTESGTLNEDMLSMLPESLTGRELDVARLMAQFRSDREICDMLNISMPYTKKLVSVVKEKLGLEKRGDIRKYLRS